MAVERKWTDEALASDDVSKKDLVQFIQDHAAPRFLSEQKLLGSVKNVVKMSKKEHLIKAHNDMFELNAFKGTDYDTEIKQLAAKTSTISISTKAAGDEPKEEVPRYTKTVLKKGDKTNFPKRGEKVSCYYIGKLKDGTVFDSIQPGSKKKRNQPLEFKVGKGNVIKGWDEALLTMSVGEKAEITIEPEWGYGKAGKPEAKIPPHATLIFEVDLYRID